MIFSSLLFIVAEFFSPILDFPVSPAKIPYIYVFPGAERSGGAKGFVYLSSFLYIIINAFALSFLNKI
jgi:hypothetical protein